MFSYYRWVELNYNEQRKMCSLITECVLSLQNVFSYYRWVELNYNGDGVYSDGCGPNGDKVSLGLGFGV